RWPRMIGLPPKMAGSEVMRARSGLVMAAFVSQMRSGRTCWRGLGWRLACLGGELRLADESKIGADWSDEELDAIVADYFAMLGDELAGRPYVKAHRRVALMARIERTKGSV